MNYCLPDKQLVAQSFSKAASTYDSVAHLQRLVGEQLLAQLVIQQPITQWVDLGAGTGFFSRQLQQQFPQATGTCLDLAFGMLQQAKVQQSAHYYIAGDAEHLPLAVNSTDLLFSSLALQWCSDFSKVLNEAAKVLKPNGIFAFSSLCTGTLHELKHSWQQVDNAVHVNQFRQFSDYQHLCQNSRLSIIQLEQRAHVLHYPQLRGLTHELKYLGANNLNRGRKTGLSSRQDLLALTQAYEKFRQPQGLPATWQVVYGVLRKEG